MWSRASCRVPGTVRDQITLFDAAITPQQAEDAARTVGLHDAIAGAARRVRYPVYAGHLLARGSGSCFPSRAPLQPGRKSCCWMKLPQTWTPEQNRLFWDALQRAGQNRTVVSISHRLYNRTGGRSIEI